MGKTLISVIGPTGIGKTKTSVAIAAYFGTDIISADSRQFYREMKIGTSVPSPDDLAKIKHHFIQHLSVFDYYNASMFEREALGCISTLFRDNNLVVMTGGSMMYIDAVCKGIDEVPDVDPEIRATLAGRFRREGIESLRLELKQLDSAYYGVVDLKNPKRIIHALEVCLTTGKTYSSFRQGGKLLRPFNILKIGLNCERGILFDRINRRVDEMVEAGLIEEAGSLISCRHLNPLNTVGYKEVFDYFGGKTDLPETIRLIKRNTRRYARKQLTWFLRDQEIQWFEYDQTQAIIEFIKNRIDAWQ